MTKNINLDMTLENIAAAVLNEYKEPATGSSAMTFDAVVDKINEVYLDIFNDPKDDSYLREKSYSFQVVGQGQLLNDLAIGDDEIDLVTSINFPNEARTILIDKKGFARYTANDLLTTLSGVTGINTIYLAGSSVQLGYPISEIDDLDEQELNVLFVDGIKRDFVEPVVWLENNRWNFNTFTIFDNNIFLDGATQGQIATFIYNKKLTLLVNNEDKPTLIPGKFRPGLLVSGAITRMGVRDDMRTGFEWHERRYETQINKFYAFANNRVQSKGPIYRPSIYDMY